MFNFCVATPDMLPDRFERFVRKHILTPDDIVALVKARSLPEKCPQCGKTVEQLAQGYRHIPSQDQTTLTFSTIDGVPTFIQRVSSGCCVTLTCSVGMLVQRNLERELRASNKLCHASIL